MANEYKWYQKVKKTDELQQGDFITGCPIIIPPKEILQKDAEVIVKAQYYNVIVMSQSCDLLAKKVKLVLLCPYTTLDEVAKDNNTYSTGKGKNILREGHVVYSHLLNKCDIRGFEHDFIVVDFRNIFALPIEILSELILTKGSRLRLLPPYREHLSQAFARYFMRVGLPEDIPVFPIK